MHTWYTSTSSNGHTPLRRGSPQVHGRMRALSLQASRKDLPRTPTLGSKEPIPCPCMLPFGFQPIVARPSPSAPTGHSESPKSAAERRQGVRPDQRVLPEVDQRDTPLPLCLSQRRAGHRRRAVFRRLLGQRRRFAGGLRLYTRVQCPKPQEPGIAFARFRLRFVKPRLVVAEVGIVNMHSS